MSSNKKFTAEENDERIGWPEPLQREGESGPVYTLHLTGFTKSSQKEVMDALHTLCRHGIRLEDLNAGSAVGKEYPEGCHTAKEVYVAEKNVKVGLGLIVKLIGTNPTISLKGWGRVRAQDKYPSCSMFRVGTNFVDFLVPPEAAEGRKYTSTKLTPWPGEQWPRMRVREMTPPPIPADAVTTATSQPAPGASTPCHSEDKRIFR